jgi:preprotein translocase subunit SecD
VEISVKYGDSLGLSNRFEGKTTWTEAADARARNDVTRLGHNYLYSRDCKDQTLAEEVRRRKRYEYFFLAREPEIDEEGALVKKGTRKRLTSGYIRRARRDMDRYSKPCVTFWFDDKGAALMRELTRKNSPTDQGEFTVERQLAIVLDGEVMSAPNLLSEIGESAQITGGRNGFTAEEVDSLVSILRSKALPATLKPRPVKMVFVQPKTKE